MVRCESITPHGLEGSGARVRSDAGVAVRGRLRAMPNARRACVSSPLATHWFAVAFNASTSMPPCKRQQVARACGWSLSPTSAAAAQRRRRHERDVLPPARRSKLQRRKARVGASELRLLQQPTLRSKGSGVLRSRGFRAVREKTEILYEKACAPGGVFRIFLASCQTKPLNETQKRVDPSF